MQNYSFSTSKTSIPIHIFENGATLSSLSKSAQGFAAFSGFTGRLGEIVKLPNEDGALSAILFGWGDEASRARGRLHFGAIVDALPENDFHIATMPEGFDANQAALAWGLAAYSFAAYLSKKSEFPRLVAPENIDKSKLETIITAAHRSMALINEPANVMTPSRLEKEIYSLADIYGAKVNSIVGDALLGKNFPLIHAVGRAGGEAPRLVEMVWGDKDNPPVTLVGKGVCFDTGGLNLKPGSSMALMKKDMGGAANTIALAEMIMGAGLAVYLRLLVPIVENNVSANAFRPGDILTGRNGKTIEINNTDAEGRLILADALAYAAEAPCDKLMTMATLTGAARVALGPDLPPFFTDDDAFSEALLQKAGAVEDPLWRMPFWAPYEEMIEPSFAELDNAPSGGMAGAITAALFLRRFAGDAPYTHFDIFGWTPAKKPGRPKGGACMATRTIFAVLEDEYGR